MGSGRASELILEAAGSLRVAEAGDPFGRGREQHAVSGRAGTDPGRDRAVGLAGARGRVTSDRFCLRRLRFAGELSEEPGHDEHRLFGDVDGVPGNAL
jgi:hypothetical protein